MGILVTDLVTEEVPDDYHDHVERYVMDAAMGAAPWAGDGPAPDTMIRREIVPLHRLCRDGRPDLHLGYTERVKELLGVPIEVIFRERDAAQANASAYNRMYVKTANRITRWRFASRWQRLKWAWRGDFPEEP